jgi:uncharacterized membrane protein
MANGTKPRRMMRILLVGSLAVNVLLIGLMVGAAVSGRGAPPRGFDVQLGPIANILPREDRRKIGRDIRRTLADAVPRGAERGAAVAEIAAILEADPFDAEAFVAQIQSEQVMQDRVRGVALSAVADHVATMPATERAKLAARLREEMSRVRRK